MATLELFIGSLIAGLGLLLAAVGAVAWRRTAIARMGLSAAGFACAGAGGLAYAALVVLQGAASPQAPLALAAGTAAALVLFYLALFRRAD